MIAIGDFPESQRLNLHCLELTRRCDSEIDEILTDVRQFDRSPGSLLVSTVGIPDAMVRCATRFPGVNLALSLHSVSEEKKFNPVVETGNGRQTTHSRD